MAGQIHALVVGIDVYPDPRDRLSGCTNDARAIAAFLESRIAHPQLSLKVLLNQDATRQALIDGFRTHLGQATAGDTVLFFFAGHGSQERAPEIFWRIEPDHLDETLVCHDSRTPGSWDLADKELALLIHEVAARQPHVVVVLDCCHSGSGTRAAQWNDVVRRCQTDVRERPAEAFLAGVLGTSAGGRTRGDSGWDTPAAGRHVLLAACRDDQEAKEYFTPTERRGAFSWFLLETLQNGRSTLTYREAHARAKASLEVKVASQTPQLEATHDEDLDRPFLGGAIVSQSGIYTARHQPDSGWRLNAGRLNGISAARAPSEPTSRSLMTAPTSHRFAPRVTRSPGRTSRMCRRRRVRWRSTRERSHRTRRTGRSSPAFRCRPRRSASRATPPACWRSSARCRRLRPEIVLHHTWQPSTVARICSWRR